VLRRAIDKWLKAGVLKEGSIHSRTEGTPQGGVISPLLANIYLHEVLDLWFERDVKPRMAGRVRLIRYADDFVILFTEEGDARRVMEVLPKRFGKYGLTLHPEKTHIVDMRETSFSFLGYSFRGKLRFPRGKSHRKFVNRIRDLTPRKSGDSLEVIIQRIMRSTQGWFNYFRHCHWSIFRDYDGMIRRRLRRLLLKRHRRNPQRLPRNQRWPDAYFADRGFVSLNATHVCFVQSTGTY